MKCMDRKYAGLSPWDQSHYSYDFEQFENVIASTANNIKKA